MCVEWVMVERVVLVHSCDSGDCFEREHSEFSAAQSHNDGGQLLECMWPTQQPGVYVAHNRVYAT